MRLNSLMRTLLARSGKQGPSICWKTKVTSGKQDRMIMFMDTASKERLKLFKPIFKEKAKEKRITQATCYN